MSSKTKTEHLKESWVEFIRIYCKEGFLDRWVGDSINNPNLSHAKPFNINAIVTYWRLNGTSPWFREMNKDFTGTVFLMADDHTSEKIWQNHMVNSQLPKIGKTYVHY